MKNDGDQIQKADRFLLDRLSQRMLELADHKGSIAALLGRAKEFREQRHVMEARLASYGELLGPKLEKLERLSKRYFERAHGTLT